MLCEVEMNHRQYRRLNYVWKILKHIETFGKCNKVDFHRVNILWPIQVSTISANPVNVGFTRSHINANPFFEKGRVRNVMKKKTLGEDWMGKHPWWVKFLFWELFIRLVAAICGSTYSGVHSAKKETCLFWICCFLFWFSLEAILLSHLCHNTSKLQQKKKF